MSDYLTAAKVQSLIDTAAIFNPNEFCQIGVKIIFSTESTKNE